MSKDVRKGRLGQGGSSKRKRILTWIVVLAAGAGGSYAAYRYSAKETTVEVPVAKVRLGEFVISVKTRGEIKATRSEVLTAPQVPDPRITRLSESGRPVKKGDVVVEFDAAQQEQNLIERSTGLRTTDSQIVQTKASHRITDEMDQMNLMTADFNVKRAQLEASKAEIVSAIEGAKSRIDVGVTEGEHNQVKTTIKSHDVAQQADLDRLGEAREKVVRDVERAKGYLGKMVIKAPIDGIINVLPNFRTQGSWGQSPPPFKEGDRAWTGAAIAEIPDLNEMRIDLKLEEVDRGKLTIGHKVRIRVDAIPEKEFLADLDWISPIAQVTFRGMGMSEKTFPARATLKNLDGRLRPGMSASAEVLIETQPGAMLIPIRASFMHQGKPAVYVQRGQQFLIRPIEVGKRNETDMVVLKGLNQGEVVTLENPIEAAKRAKKL
ncbi:MAG: HlyD family efflux transporter periplasmic adaptor subunit [Acidobacteria bacterium]|nr:HlyD family efflux transporter periplasmic adaptor subunit [Acidobacteriota bacterium]